MGLNIKEIFKNLNKKTVIIVAVIVFVILACAIGGFEYYNYKKFQAENARKISEAMERLPIDISGQEQPKRPSEYNVGIDYNTAMQGKKPVLTLFFADWCGYCIRFMPIFEEIGKKYSDQLVLAKVNVEDEAYADLVKNIGIGGFPTVYILDPKYDNKVLISNAKLTSVDTLSEELDRFLRIRKLLDK